MFAVKAFHYWDCLMKQSYCRTVERVQHDSLKSAWKVHASPQIFYHVYNLTSPKCFHFFKVLVAKLCLTLCDRMDYSLPGSSVHGVLQARILERTAISFSRGFFQSRDRTQVSCIVGRFFTTEPLGDSLIIAHNRI